MKTWDKTKDIALEYLADISELFDCECLTDIEQMENKSFRTVYALGWKDDLSAGIRGSVLTPYFPNLDELMLWCQSEEGLTELNKEGREMFGEDWYEMLGVK
jgi:hypothetical protein